MVNWSIPLRFLDVSRTIYSGELPKSIGKMKFIQHLFMSECKFNRSIPAWAAWLGNLTQLIDLDLSINYFGGEMPSSISNLFVLSYLDLRSNNIHGKIHKHFWLLTCSPQLEIFWTLKIAILQEHYQYGLGISRELLRFSLLLTTSRAKSHHHFQT